MPSAAVILSPIWVVLGQTLCAYSLMYGPSCILDCAVLTHSVLSAPADNFCIVMMGNVTTVVEE